MEASLERLNRLFYAKDPSLNVEVPAPTPKMVVRPPREFHSFLSTLKVPTSTKRRPFLVADLETVLLDDTHVPYAVGFMVVDPEKPLSPPYPEINTWFSEDYDRDTLEARGFRFPKGFHVSLEFRSAAIIEQFFQAILVEVEQRKGLRTVYFHNLGRFDGVFILKHLAQTMKKKEGCFSFSFKPLLRNNRVYQITIFRETQGDKKRFVFRFRDSLQLLRGKLGDLGKTFCPELGPKGTVPHGAVTLDKLGDFSESMLAYMRQDILLLGGIMRKAQEQQLEEDQNGRTQEAAKLGGR